MDTNRGDWLHRDSLAPGWNGRLARFVPYAFAVATGYQILKYVVVEPRGIGFDARLYAAASRAWLNGADPWQVQSLGIFYGAPPPTLLAYAPLTILPEPVLVWGTMVGSVVLAAIALRSLSMPLWWLLSWPIVDSVLVGNPDAAVFALLVLLRGRISWIAPFLKAYAVLPLIGDRRTKGLAMVAIIVAGTAFVLPWGQWWSSLPVISARLESVSDTTSVFGMPVLMVIGAVALLSLGIRRASWLAVPVLWPSTQPHYLAMSTPAMSPWLAIAWSLPHPYVVVSSVVVEAIAVRAPSRRMPVGGLTTA